VLEVEQQQARASGAVKQEGGQAIVRLLLLRGSREHGAWSERR